MNLVAVLIAPTVVALADDKPARALIVLVAVALLAWALWRSSHLGGVTMATQAAEGAPTPDQTESRPTTQRSST